MKKTKKAAQKVATTKSKETINTFLKKIFSQKNKIITTIFVICLIIISMHFIASILSNSIISSIWMMISVYTTLIIGCWWMYKNIGWRIFFQLVIFLGLVFSLELGMRIKKDLPVVSRSYSEQNGSLFYHSIFKLHNWWPNNRPLLHEPSTQSVDEKVDFVITYSYNNMGLRMVNNLPKHKNEFRICVLGDSYTEGVGAPDGFDFPAQLQKLYRQNQSDQDTVVVNMGVSGFDPVDVLQQYQQVTQSLEPDLVIYQINQSDPNDIMDRGGLERISRGYKTGPWWETIYGFSYVFRRLISVRYTSHFVLKGLSIDNLAFQSAVKTVTVVDSIKSIAKKHGAEFVTVAVLTEHEINNFTIDLGLGKTIKMLGDQGIPCLFTPIFYEQERELSGQDSKSFYQLLYWSHDYHHNSDGYALLARSVYKGLKQRDSISWNPGTIFH
jgi:lysophospholipase L1-like esterase